MPTERQSPDAVLASSNLTGGIGDIQNDPDFPDGLWMEATGNNVNIDVRTSFPTPTGNPTVGADLQELRTRVRESHPGQAGWPLARIELWENGVLIRAGPNRRVWRTDYLQPFSLYWDAAELATPDGSLVECKVVGLKTGGSPSNRNTVDVEAVEWNVYYGGASPPSESGMEAQII